MAQLNFDASQVSPADSFDAIPAGWYNAMITESEMKPTKAEGGMRLSVCFTILDGQYAGRKIFTGLNLKNANPVAQEIAYKQLSAICHAVGVIQVADSQQLHGKPLKIKVKVKAASGDYEASNEITTFKNINEAVEGGSGAGPAAAAPWANQPAPQAAPMAQPAQAAPAWQAPAAAQPWMQQVASQALPAPTAQPAPVPTAAPAGGTPPWMQQAASQATPGAAPPWAQS